MPSTLKTPIETLIAIDQRGGKTSMLGDKVRIVMKKPHLDELNIHIQRNKESLRELVLNRGGKWTMITWTTESKRRVPFFIVIDESTKRTLIKSGAHPEFIYFADEIGTVLIKASPFGD